MGKLFASGWGLVVVLLASTCCSAQAQPSRPDTLATHYREPRLGLQLRVPVSFEAEASPTGPPPPELTARLHQLLGRNPATASVLAYFSQAMAPHSALAVVQLPEAHVSWLAWGFQAWRPGRFYRGSKQPPFTQELACALPTGGWLYLRAEVPLAAYGPSLDNTPELGRTLAVLYGSRIFPSLTLAPGAALLNPRHFARYADSLVRYTPGGNPLPALAALGEARHGAGSSLITPAEYAANPALPRSQHRFGRLLDPALWYLGDAVDKLESWTNAPAQRGLYSESGLDYISFPEPLYGGDQAYGCFAGTVYSAHEAVPDILRRVRGKQAVLFNENVYQPQHRTLLALPALYAEGFRYLAVSSLNGADAGLNKRPYPNLQRHEFAPDYQFANLIRTARQLGFTLIGFADTTQPAGILQTMPLGVSAALDKAYWERRRQPINKLRPALDALPPAARVVVLAPGQEALWNTDGAERRTTVRLLNGWGGRAVLAIDQLHVEQDVCVSFGQLLLPPRWQRLDSLPRPDLVRTVYVRYPAVDRPGLLPARPLAPTADLTVYNRLDAGRLPLPYPAAQNARAVVLDLAPYRSSSRTGRRVLQLYLLAELTGPHPGQVPPVYTHEIGPSAGLLTLRLCPGTYRYVIRSTAAEAEVQAVLTVTE